MKYLGLLLEEVTYGRILYEIRCSFDERKHVRVTFLGESTTDGGGLEGSISCFF